jgi:hypothetical protein
MQERTPNLRKETAMQSETTKPTKHPCDASIQLFADTIAEQFGMPAAEALLHINAALGADPLTRGIVLDLRRPPAQPPAVDPRV